jgi:hypothetical protein
VGRGEWGAALSRSSDKKSNFPQPEWNDAMHVIWQGADLGGGEGRTREFLIPRWWFFFPIAFILSPGRLMMVSLPLLLLLRFAV